MYFDRAITVKACSLSSRSTALPDIGASYLRSSKRVRGSLRARKSLYRIEDMISLWSTSSMRDKMMMYSQEVHLSNVGGVGASTSIPSDCFLYDPGCLSSIERREIE